jgi:iron complex outermembrane receptor protein
VITRDKRKLFLFGLTAGTLGLTTPFAGTLAANSDAAESGLAEIVITAERRSEPLLKAPVTITAISGDQLAAKGIVSAEDLQNIVPGVTMNVSGNGPVIGIRGVQSTDTSAKGQQDIEFNIDGADAGRGLERSQAFFDLERVEVLRGPQGTLYGQSSTGGAVNVITNKPQLGELDGYLKAEYGNYNAKRTEAAINLPIGDVWAIRISGATNQRDGYARPVSYDTTINGTTYFISNQGEKPKNDEDNATLRTQVLFQPNDIFSARITGTFGNVLGVGQDALVQSFLTGPKSQQLDVFANPVPAYNDAHFANYGADFNVKLGGGAQLDVLASDQKTNMFNQRTDDEIINYTGSAFAFNEQVNQFRTKQYEVRVSNSAPSVIDYVAGVNYYHEDILENGRIWQDPIATFYDPATYQHVFEVNNESTHEATGAFGQITWHATDQLGVVAGLRYTRDETKRIGYIAPPLPFYACSSPGWYPAPCFPSPSDQALPPSGAGGLPDDGQESDSKVTWRVGLNYQLDPNNLLFADVATGFKGGGFNDYCPSTGTTCAYGPSSLTAFEIGYKGHPVSKLTLTSDLWYYDFQKDQITGVDSFPAAGQTIIYTVSTPATLYGWESELSYQVASRTIVSATVSLEHSSFKNYQAGDIEGDTVNWSGQSLDQTPKFVLTAGLDQGFGLPNDGEIRFRGFIRYSDSYLLSDFGTAVRYEQPSYTRSDLSLTYAAPKDRYTVQLFVQNVENKVQRTGLLTDDVGPYGGVGGQTQVGGVPTYPTPGNGQLGNQPFGYVNFFTNTPRFFGVRMSVKF